MANYQLTVITLTPLHIGTGNELRHGFDFTMAGNRTYRLNVDKILEARGDRLKRLPNGNYELPSRLLTTEDLRAQPEFFRYNLAGTPRSEKADARMQECIKDVFDCVYIPGSSLKGAFRTALAWAGWKEVQPVLSRDAIGRSRNWAGQPLEKKFFGSEPNLDLLRALQVSDCAGSDKPGFRLIALNAQVLTPKGPGSPISLEAIAGDTQFTGSLKIDETLFSKMAEPVLHFSNRRHWLDQLLERIRAHSQARIDELLPWFEGIQSAAPVARFYRQLKDTAVQSNQAILQLGWGAGWDSKTFGSHLRKQTRLFEQLIAEFKMQKAGKTSSPRKPGVFPTSRRVAMKQTNAGEVIAAPIGWVLIELEQQ